jgi:hypothetical protein
MSLRWRLHFDGVAVSVLGLGRGMCAESRPRPSTRAVLGVSALILTASCGGLATSNDGGSVEAGVDARDAGGGDHSSAGDAGPDADAVDDSGSGKDAEGDGEGSVTGGAGCFRLNPHCACDWFSGSAEECAAGDGGPWATGACPLELVPASLDGCCVDHGSGSEHAVCYYPNPGCAPESRVICESREAGAGETISWQKTPP